MSLSQRYKRGTNDSSEALRWTMNHPLRSGPLIQQGSTNTYFQFAETISSNNSSLYFYYRVHKLSYIDRTMCIDNVGLINSGPIGTLASVPVAQKDFIEAIQYLYFHHPY